MHEAAYAWVALHAGTTEAVSVLDIGGLDNRGPWGGSVRPLFPNADPYQVLDLCPGEGVDIVADAATWEPDRCFDVVVAVECFEHAYNWPAICLTAMRALVPGGLFCTTMAGPGRTPHGALGGAQPLPGEWYANVHPDDLRAVLNRQGWEGVLVDRTGLDVRARATTPVL